MASEAQQLLIAAKEREDRVKAKLKQAASEPGKSKQGGGVGKTWGNYQMPAYA